MSAMHLFYAVMEPNFDNERVTFSTRLLTCDRRFETDKIFLKFCESDCFSDLSIKEDYIKQLQGVIPH